MSVDHVLKAKGHSLHSIHPHQTLAEAADVLAKHRIGVAVVCEGSTVVGMLSERDIVQAISHQRAAALTRPVRQFMSSPVVTCGRKDRIKDIMEIMSNRRIRHLPVVEGDAVVGLISIGDVIKHRLAEKQMEAAVLRDYALALR